MTAPPRGSSVASMVFPNIDPIAIQLGPLAIRWYSLAYLGGIILGWWCVRSLHANKPIAGLTKDILDDMVVWTACGIVFGGRLGYVLFYKPSYYLAHPLESFHLWEGGMSFHGGLIGVIIAFLLFCRRYRLRFLEVMDAVASVVPIGLGLGRIANFINGELYGRVTDSSWGMVFPHGGPFPRYPSQLFEAATEGLLLFIVLFGLARFTAARERVGLISGLFLLGYAAARMSVEQFREPDAYLGFIIGQFTMGQLLSVPMVAVGLYLVLRARRTEVRA